MQHSVNENFDIEVDLDDNTYYVSGNYRGTISYSPGRMYSSNGDPGDPPEYDSELTYFEITSCTMNESEEKLSVIEGSDLYKAIEARLYELLDDVEIE